MSSNYVTFQMERALAPMLFRADDEDRRPTPTSTGSPSSRRRHRSGDGLSIPSASPTASATRRQDVRLDQPNAQVTAVRAVPTGRTSG